MSEIARSREHCHACNKDMVIELDLSLNGNHVIECPHCGHEHYRRVENGRVTSDRWGSANRQVYYATAFAVSGTSSSSTSNCFIDWGSTATATGGW